MHKNFTFYFFLSVYSKKQLKPAYCQEGLEKWSGAGFIRQSGPTPVRERFIRYFAGCKLTENNDMIIRVTDRPLFFSLLYVIGKRIFEDRRGLLL